MIDWLFGTVLGKCVMTFLISLLPVVELRGGIPYGISQGLDPWLAFAASALGNMLPSRSCCCSCGRSCTG